VKDILTVHCEIELYRLTAVIIRAKCILFAQYFPVAVELLVDGVSVSTHRRKSLTLFK
jgi:hypothetical protein